MIEFGSGVSMVAINEMEKMLKTSSEEFLENIFTAREIAYCTRKRNRAEHFAARYAAKEACLKALGLAPDRSVFLKIEVVRKPSGQPSLRIHEDLSRGTSWQNAQCDLSMAHERDAAIAFVLFSRKHASRR